MSWLKIIVPFLSWSLRSMSASYTLITNLSGPISAKASLHTHIHTHIIIIQKHSHVHTHSRLVLSTWLAPTIQLPPMRTSKHHMNKHNCSHLHMYKNVFRYVQNEYTYYNYIIHSHTIQTKCTHIRTHLHTHACTHVHVQLVSAE